MSAQTFPLNNKVFTHNGQYTRLRVGKFFFLVQHLAIGYCLGIKGILVTDFMKKMIQKLALLWIMLLSFMGSQKAKTIRMDMGKSGARAHEVMLDEYELSAFHSN
jgi:hypothetical protein